MQKELSSVWISSIDHLNKFSEITARNPMWKVLLALNKVPSDFPQMQIGARKFPIVFFSSGRLRLFERQMDFKVDLSDLRNSNKYANVVDDFNFEIDYKSLCIESYQYPKPLIKAFNISWIKISTLNENYPFPILLSSGGTSMSRIKKENESLFEILSEKIECGQL